MCSGGWILHETGSYFCEPIHNFMEWLVQHVAPDFKPVPLLECYSAALSSVLGTEVNGTQKRHAMKVSP